MRNLAGNDDASDWCELELRRAGVDLVESDERSRGDVPSSVAGKLGRFNLRRAWYYWVVDGEMPIEIAREIHANPIGAHDVRVHGHCGRPSPDEWCKGEPVRGYHIDSQEGLNLFASMVRKHGLTE